MIYVILSLLGVAFAAIAYGWISSYFEINRFNELSAQAQAELQETKKQIERLKNETTRDSKAFIDAKNEYKAKLLDYRNRFGGPPSSGNDGNGGGTAG